MNIILLQMVIKHNTPENKACFILSRLWNHYFHDFFYNMKQENRFSISDHNVLKVSVSEQTSVDYNYYRRYKNIFYDVFLVYVNQVHCDCSQNYKAIVNTLSEYEYAEFD